MVDGPKVSLRVERRSVEAPQGASLLAAFVRDRFPVLQRSIRYHRPRAPFCGVGYCTQCLVRVNGVPNVRACRYLPNSGDEVVTENAWPSPRHDLLGALDVMFRHGIDTLHGFRRPAFAAPLYHRVVRRLAGYGRLPDPGNRPPRPNAPRWETDVLVVGAGPSGAEAARRLVSAGRKVLVVDREPAVPPVEGAEGRSGWTVAFLPPPVPTEPRRFDALVAGPQGEAARIAAGQVVVATGGYDAGLWFGGSDRPGVVTAEAALRFGRGGTAGPFRRALLVGGGARAAEVLDRHGEGIEAVVAPGSIDSDVVRRASALDIPLYPRTLVLSVAGRSRVRSVRLAARGNSAAFSVPVDAVILAHRRLPNPQLFFQAGARMQWRSEAGAYFPVLGVGGATTVPGLFAVGEASGTTCTEDALQSAARAAEAIDGAAPSAPEPPRWDVDRPAEIDGYYRELLARPRSGGKWIACACEDVLLAEVEEASRRGFRGIEVVKRYTSLGTGMCQGRYCIPDTLLLLARLEGRAPAEVGYITQRPPVTPVPLEALASVPDGRDEEGR